MSRFPLSSEKSPSSPSPSATSVPRQSGCSPTRRAGAAGALVSVGAGFLGVALLVVLAAVVGAGESASAYTRTWTAHHQAAPNPVLQPGCGLDVGLLIDRSGSIARVGADAQMRAAAHTFIDALTGTPSRIGVWSFGNASAATPGDPDHPVAPLTEVGGTASAPGIAALKATVDSIPFAGKAATNWDAGFRAVHEAGATAESPLDLLVVLTDGQPTVHGSGSSLDPFTEDADIDAGIASANLVKSDGTRVFAVGIGADIDTAALSLVSGGTPWSGSNLASADYATTSFGQLAATLRAAVSDLCGGTISVQKVMRDGSGAEVPESGWRFELTSAAHQAWTTGELSDDAGMAQFSVASVGVERVSIREEVRPGVQLLVDEIRCDNASGLQPVIQRDEHGVSFDLGPRDVIACTFPNLRAPVAEPTTTTTTPTTVAPTPPTTVTPSTTTTTTGDPTGQLPAPNPDSTVVVAETPKATVLALTQEPARSATLPRTGADTGRLVLAGLCLVAGGSATTVGLRQPRVRRR